MKALGVLESKWDPIRQKLVRRLLEEQDKVLRSYFAQKEGASKGVHACDGNPPWLAGAWAHGTRTWVDARRRTLVKKDCIAVVTKFPK